MTQTCIVVNSGSMATVELDPDTISRGGFGNTPPPDWAPCWLVMENLDGSYGGVGWLPAPPWNGRPPGFGVDFF